MKGRDFVLVPLSALAVMVLNVAIAFGIVWLYSSFVEPGHPAAHYEAFAARIAPVSSVVAGIPLMFVAGWLIGRARPLPRALLVAGAAALLYIAIDIAVLWTAGAGQEVWMWAALSHATKLVAALAGARSGSVRQARIAGSAMPR